MKKNFDFVTIAKIGGYLLTGLGAILGMWATDKATQKQNDENFEKYIAEKEKKEGHQQHGVLLFIFVQKMKGENKKK